MFFQYQKQQQRKALKPLPRRIVLIRHGESMGNATTETKEWYRSTPDYKIPLTALGHTQARDAGKRLKAMLDSDGCDSAGKVKFFCSPHLRTKQTLEGVLTAIPPERRLGDISYDNLLREIDRGFYGQTFETATQWMEERTAYGPAHYRFPGHDSILDVMQRVATFLGILQHYLGAGRLGNDDTLVIVGHHGSHLQLVGRLQACGAVAANELHMPNCAVVSFDRHTFTEPPPHGGGADVVTRCYSATAKASEELGLLPVPVTPEQAENAARQLAKGLHTGLVFIN